MEHGHQHERYHKEHLDGPVEVRTPALQRMYEFHGHLGPYVVLGYRAGMYARELLESPGYFDLTVEVVCPLATPRSCFLDGVQLGAGCTVGKRNLTVIEGSAIRCVFRRKSGECVIVALAPDIPVRLKELIAADGVEATGERMMSAPIADLFLVEDA